jgi:putative hydrolase of the HAD superfamily
MNIVFDFGAVLFNWQPAQLVASTFREQTGTLAAAQALGKNLFSHADWHAFDKGTLSLDEVVARSATRLGLPHAPLHGLVSGIGEHLAPLQDTVAVLASLHSLRTQRPDLRLYYLSNMPEPFARVLEQRHAFLQWFDDGIFSGDVKLIKPEPEIFELLTQRHNLKPADTVFIDDLASNISAAKDHGWHGIQFHSAQELQADLDLWFSR